MKKKWIAVFLLVLTILCNTLYMPVILLAQAEETKESDTLVHAPSAVLMEAQTGTVLYAKDENTRRSPASITKIMTLILIFEAMEQ